LAVPKKPLQWEVYRPIKGSPGAFIGVVEAPDEASALKTAIEEFGIINAEHQNRLFVRRVPSDDELDR
jgi:1,2-phenylacetyl-CoA epoxidase PaaB subunit